MGNRNNRRGLPQWEARCSVGPSAQWIFRRTAQTQANTEASPFLSIQWYKSFFFLVLAASCEERSHPLCPLRDTDNYFNREHV
ncbi:unnamed protein product [Lasius platythorax]|uniref:Uncharacterized protein n=1 Tax=Lasius platythorax TaxID=488582 RepID=A0AAV2NJM3_9HYME